MYIICVECSTSRAPGMEWGDRAGSFMMRKDWDFYDADVTLVKPAIQLVEKVYQRPLEL